MTKDLTEISRAITQHITALLLAAGCETADFNATAITNYTHIRNAMIRRTYRERRAAGEKAEAIYAGLQEEYLLARETVRGICQGKR